MGPPLRNWGMQ